MNNKSQESATLYDVARSAMYVEIERYLRLASISDGFTVAFADSDIQEPNDLELLAAGFDLRLDGELSLINAELRRKRAIPFDVEAAVTRGVYARVRPYAAQLYEEATHATQGWTDFSLDIVHQNPRFLPVFQHVSGVFSKSELKKLIGSGSDRSLSRTAAQRLTELLERTVVAENVNTESILARLEATLEGIVRDLVGRLLLEEVVAQALQREDVPFLREDEYSSLAGVVYDFRADFVIPDHRTPVAFIEVRKSSSRHASLYAKDKMFSAINWKGRHKRLIGVVVTEGDWTQTTLRTMARVFDYVLPLSRSAELAKVMRRACDGDDSVLKWLVDFSIAESPEFKHTEPTRTKTT